MSKAYQLRIPWHLVLSNSELSRQRVRISFELLRILAVERMQELLTGCLTGEGKGMRNPDGTVEITLPGRARLSVDPAAGTIEIDVASLLPETLQASVWDLLVPPELQKNGSRIELPPDLSREKLDSLLSSGNARTEIDRQVGQLREETRALVLRETIAARKTLNEALKEVYRQAIREKAEQLGTVTGVSESGDGAVWRLRVEIVK